MKPNKLSLITGASAGLGAEFAHQYAQKGWDVALTARRADRLDKLARELEEKYQVATLVITQDLAHEASVDVILAELREAGRHVDALVNNAGYGLPGTFFNTSWEDQAQFIRVLYTAPVELVHKLLPGMAERGFGRIINVASLAGYTPGSNGHTLYASVKAGIIKFSESIHAEAQAAGHDIHCTALCPGFTWTEFHDVNGTRKMASESPKWMWMEAGPVVEAGIDGVTRGRPVVVPGAVNKGVAMLTRILPEPLGREIMKQQSKRFRKTETD
ncbi:SDR family NAD(P)-dependent oxidoreductase [Henriciella aquimarina]|uniref:SDR family NAD(P)-dependent oxidoreductase n=1 Tax=Henriciella aquimarina TaxID=545261 RepID=UPI000A043830|nr:SDR family oxidoreductase [Henriciella aquimarina]